jgi:hypothetical protein
MKSILKFSTILFIFFVPVLNLNAQDEKKECPADINLGVDLMNRFIWRGMNFGGSTPSIQAYSSISVKNFEWGVWSAYSIANFNNQEFDLFASYTFAKDMFTIIVTDYYSASDVVDYNYFDYKKEFTGHFYEGCLCFNGTDKFPFTLMAAMNFYGADASRINNDPSSPNFNSKSGIQYSNYFEPGFFCELKGVKFNGFFGFTLNKPKNADSSTGYLGETGFYGSSPGFVNIGFSATKEIPITEKFSLPLTTSIITNPQKEKVFFVIGISL